MSVENRVVGVSKMAVNLTAQKHAVRFAQMQIWGDNHLAALRRLERCPVRRGPMRNWDRAPWPGATANASCAPKRRRSFHSRLLTWQEGKMRPGAFNFEL
ncbi:hypothetical protein LBMAG56_21010 [Verrucomicrobiota bacterium]|nr:hypothetical protein LBMAG56_21010 [Verrucomicrobiota bacterium]